MKWTRRNFLQLTGGLASTLALGAVPAVVGSLKGKAFFNDWRALPGMPMVLTLEVEAPEKTQVEVVVGDDSGSHVVTRLQGAPTVEVRVPMLKTSQESYILYARVMDSSGRSLNSEPVEVIAESFHFGM